MLCDSVANKEAHRSDIVNVTDQTLLTIIYIFPHFISRVTWHSFGQGAYKYVETPERKS